MNNEMKEYDEIEISKLVPYENNARTHSEDQLNKIANSIKEFGFINPVIIDENNMILVGHGRTLGAERVGLKKVPYIRVTDLTDEQKKAYILADNRLSDLGGWDMEKLSQELEQIQLDMAQFGFDDISDLEIDTEVDIDESNPYTTTINIPQYEITGDEPPIEELYDDEKTQELIKEINQANITAQQKKCKNLWKSQP